MSGGSTILKDIFKEFRDSGVPVKKAVLLQVLVQEDDRILLTDGRNTIHFGYDAEETAFETLEACLENGGFEETHLDGSYFSFAEISFDYFWNMEKKELQVCLLSTHVRLVDSGIGQKKPQRTFYITLELSTRRYEMLKRQAMAKNASKIEEGLPIDDIFALKTTGGIYTSLQKEEGMEEEDDESSNSENGTAKFGDGTTNKDGENTNASNSITPNKVEITKLGEEELKLLDKENLNTANLGNKGQSETLTGDNLEKKATEEVKKRKPRVKKPKPTIEKQVEATKEELAMMAGELDDLDLDEEALKEMRRVKLNNDPIRRGGQGTITEDKIFAPQSFGYSFGGFAD